jgi:alpha-tubulin suppressor-like RCC1 family protein
VHTCALTSAGGAKCWGGNYYGELGDGTTTDRHTPVAVSGLASGVAAISAGFHTCALTSAGGAKCWGFNASGQLGDGTTTERHRPVDVSGLASGVAAIVAATQGDYPIHTCALTSGGGVKCWGGNDHGQLGDGTTTERHTPVDVVGLASGVAAIAAGDGHTCALTSGGGVTCWGSNRNGQLGDGTKTDRHTAVDVVGLASGVAAISAAGSHTCALTSAGGVKCWGGNGFGQLGDGTTTNRRTPVDVSGLASGVAAIAAGYSHTCALTSAGGAKCWGRNHYGQLGDGTTTQHHTPVAVVGFGGSLKCIVPNVIGKLLATAKARIAEAHCRVGAVTKKPSTLKKKGRVLAQKPRAGKKLKNRARVNLTVGK